ncbi:MAG: hypothetical protein JXB38_22325, partial [Anaerolineales bacterium]|nr:hypothetical protein [Anaerolineales bacterium]
DLIVLRVQVDGLDEGKEKSVVVELIDFHDKETGFRAMERTTGWPPAIVCYLMAHGEIEPGATPLEVAVPPDRFLEELSKREFQITETVTVKEAR